MRTPCQTLFAIIVLLSTPGCRSWRSGPFFHRSPREAYASGLDDGGAWLRDADSALAHPAWISLPYREFGHIPRSLNAAAAIGFELRQGEQLTVGVDPVPGTAAPFIELHRQGQERITRENAPAPGTPLRFMADAPGSFLLLLQSRSDTETSYTLRVVAGPSLAYPATNPGKNRIGSVWGDDRDAGARRHEGVDIFAPKGSPALAAAAGRITRLGNGGIGGKTVWLRPDNRGINLYYAHLDSQLVHEGDYVEAGDTVGLIGNTGNARTTAAHLHFGIYTASGSVNPAPFVRPRDTMTPPVRQSPLLIGSTRKLRNAAGLSDNPTENGTSIRRLLPAGTQLVIVAATVNALRVRVNDTLRGWLPFSKDMFEGK